MERRSAMKAKTILIALLLSIGTAIAQQVLTDSNYNYAFALPESWTFKKYDAKDSFIRFECFNKDSTAALEIYSIKAEGVVNLDKFAEAMVSEKTLGKSLGTLKDTKKNLIGGIAAIDKHYVRSTRRGSTIDIRAIFLAKKEYGYGIVFRNLNNTQAATEFEAVVESFSVQMPRSFFGWIILLGFIGVCLYGVGIGYIRTSSWMRPLNLKSIAYSSAVTVLCLAGLLAVVFAFQKIGLWVSLISGAVFWFAIKKIPDSKPVIKAYEEAKKTNTAGAYRSFCQNNKSSLRYYKDARRRMHALMDGVVTKYRKMIANNNTPIIRAALAMFEYIKKTDKFQVGVHYTSISQFQDYTEYYKSRNWKVLPADAAFTEKKNRKRERFITALINFAFHKITPEDILGFSTVKSPTDDQIAFNVKYTISTSGMLYHRTKEDNLPDDKKTRFTGVDIKWDLQIKIPNHYETYRFSLESKPAEHFTARGEGTDKVYDAMAASAFADFCRAFIQQSGFLPVVHKSLIDVTIEDGQKKFLFKITDKDIIQGLTEFAETEEGFDLHEVAHEYQAIVSELASGIADMDVSFDFDFSFDD